jgi:hypothetical protein
VAAAVAVEGDGGGSVAGWADREVAGTGFRRRVWAMMPY